MPVTLSLLEVGASLAAATVMLMTSVSVAAVSEVAMVRVDVPLKLAVGL